MHLSTHLSPHKKKPNKILNRHLVLVASLWLFVSIFCLYPLGCCALRLAEWQLVLLVYVGTVFFP